MKTQLTLVGVRVVRTYLQGLVGFLTVNAAGIDLGIPAMTFANSFLLAASLAAAPAVVSLIHNIIELLAGYEASAIRG
jgi:hypothetical protein